MKLSLFCLLLVHFFANAQTEDLEWDIQVPLREKVSYFDVLIEDLKNAGWSTDEQKCFEQTLAVLEGAKNFTLWATWVWDSNQLPTGVLYGSRYQLGNYDECLKAPWTHSHPELKTQYCLVNINLTSSEPKLTKRQLEDPHVSAEKHINTITRHGRELNILTWGVCIPASCSGPESVSRIAKVLLQNSHLASASFSIINVDSCQPSRGTAVEEPTAGYYNFKYFVLFLMLMTILSTCYTVQTKDNVTDSIVCRIAHSFCLRRNGHDMVKDVTDDMPALHGMRAMTTILMILGHVYWMTYSFAQVNGLNTEEYMNSYFWIVMHGDILSDSFMVFSGLLLMYGLMTRKKLENPFKTLLKLFIRSNGIVAVMVWYIASVAIYMNDGPLWKRFIGREQTYCERNWWLNLLMLNNYFNVNEICHLVSWFSATNFQLTVFGLALFYLCRSHRRAGVVTIATVAVLSIILPGLNTYYKGQFPTLVADMRFCIDLRKVAVFIDGYCETHLRVVSYLVGLGCGYILSVYKPSLHRNKIGKMTSVFLVLLIVYIGVSIMAKGGLYTIKEYSALEGAVYSSTNRLLYSIFLVLCIFTCEYGSESIITRLLSWKGWLPLSRLSFGALMTHVPIMQHQIYSGRAPLTAYPTVFTECFGFTTMSFIIGALLWLLVQAPLNNLTNEILNPRKVAVIQAKNSIQENRHKTKTT